MRIVIDMQGAQSESRFRGIGRYAMGFALGIVRNRGEHEVILALNGLFPHTIEPIRAAFDDLLPQENIRVWFAPGPVFEGELGNDARREVAEFIREAFLASLQPDIIHVISFLEGYVDDAVTSIGRFDINTPVCVTLYDLIPLLNPDQYLKPNPAYQECYLRKIEQLKKASGYLAISESSRQEGIQGLGRPEFLFANAFLGVEAHFKPVVVNEVEADRLREKFGLRRQFFLYTGSADERKNLPRLIEAFAALPDDLRSRYQLLLAGKMSDDDIEKLKQVAYNAGLAQDELCFAGFVSDEELVQLYNLCVLFVFPSWHEGFGLPVLEAMRCGKAVIAANTSSLPEVVGREDALFDPFDTLGIARKMAQVFSDDTFRAELERHGLVQARKFSWDETATKALLAFETMVGVKSKAVLISSNLPRLAYVSPLPPETSGISDYSVELLPELSRYYHIEVIVAQERVSNAWVHANCPIRDVAWFRQHAREFDRILYHFGNSPFHSHMFGLLYDHPGVLVLHDFFLSGIISHREEVTGETPYGWAKALLESHGWSAVKARFQNQDTGKVVMTYPCNLQVLQNALGVIVHSDYSRQLACEWYGERAADNWQLIPHLRKSAGAIDRTAARHELNIPKNMFVVCSFGHLDPVKLNHRLLAAWLASPLAQDAQCRLVFVGKNHGGDYGDGLVRTIRHSEVGIRIEITGWADGDTFCKWLTAADVGVQLRTLSRGETSGTVLDCMNYGLPTIVNAHGSMAELDQDAVWMLPDEFDDSQLVDALTTLYSDRLRRVELGNKAREMIAKNHIPHRCAALYADAIEDYYQQAAVGIPTLLAATATQQPALPPSELAPLATCIAKNVPPKPRRRQLLLDISAVVQHDLRTGVERVVRAILIHWLLNPPPDWQVEPVYATMDEEGYRYARQFTSRFLGILEVGVIDERVETYPSDIFFALDFHPYIVLEQILVLQEWHRLGVGVQFLIHDLLPVMMPEMFPDGAKDTHQRWLEAVVKFDSAVCVSRAVADELQLWLKTFGSKRERHFGVQWSHHGADTENSAPSSGLPANASQFLSTLKLRPTFLMVGTIEPRKWHLQTIAAFDQLWLQGFDVNLVVVGQEGWKGLPNKSRRTIPKIVKTLRSHTQIGKHLFWLEGISDEYLKKVYATSSCLIAASEGEGFGLPLIEAAQHKLPIIARDIPVFREVAGQYALYFENSKDPQIIAKVIMQWLELNARRQAPQSAKMPWLTWAQSAQQLMDIVVGNNQVQLEKEKS